MKYHSINNNTDIEKAVVNLEYSKIKKTNLELEQEFGTKVWVEHQKQFKNQIDAMDNLI